MLAIVPRPVKAVLLLFPIEEAGETLRKDKDKLIAKEGQPKVDDTIFWVKQKVRNSYQRFFVDSDVSLKDIERLRHYWTYPCYRERAFVFDLVWCSTSSLPFNTRLGFNLLPRVLFRSSYLNAKVCIHFLTRSHG